MSTLHSRLESNLAAVRQRIQDAAQRSGRTADQVQLVAVTKYVDSEVVSALVELGCHELGESRPQDLWQKHDLLPSPQLHWHLIGHLQRNKIRRTLPLVCLIHSVDSLRLLEELDKESRLAEKTTPVLLEVNISGDATKHGFPPEQMRGAVAAAKQLPHLQVRGLMAMASREGDLDSARDDFRRLRILRDQLAADPDLRLPLTDLSMGMSSDFDVAIEEGATIVRVGSALFEGLP